MNFSAPAVPQPNWYFDCEVWAYDRLMFKHRMPTETGGKPVQIVAGQIMALALDIAIDKINREFVKMIKPKTVVLTTRHGNMHLDVATQRLLHQTQEGERRVREMNRQDAVDATDKMKKGTR